MLRRSFRIGLTLGLLGGLAFALVKVFGARPDAEAAPAHLQDEPWPRLIPDPAAPSPVAPVVEEAVVVPQPAKAAPAKATPAKATPAKAAPAKAAPAKKKAPVKAWVEPKGGVCPTSHPVKAKLTSKIFHLPGMLNYDRTNPDRCYVNAKKAEADGLRAAKR